MKRPGTYSSSSFGTALGPVAGSCLTILADPAQATAAIGTGIGAGHQFHLPTGECGPGSDGAWV